MEDTNQNYNEIESENVPQEQKPKEEIKKPQKKPFINNSGQNNPKVPRVIKEKFNWGAFLLSWIWGLGNKVYVTLWILPAGLIPILPLGLSIWFGIKGNEWAWMKKRYEGVRQFHETQKKWAIAGTIVYIASTLIFTVMAMSVLTASMKTLNSGFSSYDNNKMTVKINDRGNKKVKFHSNGSTTYTKKTAPKEQKVYSENQIKIQVRQAVYDIIAAANKNYGYGRHQNIDFSSQGLAKYFGEGLSKAEVNGNGVNTSKAQYIFYGNDSGNGSCANMSCEIIVIANKDSNTSYPAYLKLIKLDNGKLTISDEDKQKYTGF